MKLLIFSFFRLKTTISSSFLKILQFGKLMHFFITVWIYKTLNYVCVRYVCVCSPGISLEQTSRVSSETSLEEFELKSLISNKS